MDKENLKLKFKDFVIENRVAKNVGSFLARNNVDLDSHLEYHSPELFLDGLGCWANTPEGGHFWRKLNVAWLKLLYEEAETQRSFDKGYKSIW